VVVRSCKRYTLMARYAKISNTFIVGSVVTLDEYSGAVIAGEEGFFIMFSRRQLSQAVGRFQETVAAVLPRAQPLIVKDERAYSNEQVWRGSYSDLPDEVVAHPDWPHLSDVEVVWFIPKHAVDKITTSIWYGVKIKVGEVVYNFAVGLFSHAKTRSNLRSLGWAV